MAGCTFDPTKIVVDVALAGTQAAGVAAAAATKAFRNGYWEVAVDLDKLAIAGSYTANAAADLLVCPDPLASSTNNAATAIPIFKVGQALTLKVLKDSVTGNSGLILDYNNAPIANSVYKPFNTMTTVKLEISCAADCDIDSDSTFTGAKLDVPEMFREKGITYTVDAATNDTLTVTFNGFALLPPGVYDIAIQPGVIAAASSIMAGGARVRIVYGAVPLVYNAMTSPITASVQRISSNLTETIFVTNATKIGIAQIADPSDTTTLGAAFRLSTLYDKLYPISAGNGNEDVLELLQDYATTAGSITSTTNLIGLNNFSFNARLSEGTYKLRRTAAHVSINSGAAANDVKRNIVIIVDRTAPVGTNATWTGSAQSVGGVGKVAFPATMFWDSVSNVSSQITVMSTRFIGSDGLGFYCPTPVPLNAAFCYATKIRGPSGTVLVEVVAADEAGNQAVGFFTISVVPAREWSPCSSPSRAPFSLLSLHLDSLSF